MASDPSCTRRSSRASYHAQKRRFASRKRHSTAQHNFGSKVSDSLCAAGFRIRTIDRKPNEFAIQSNSITYFQLSTGFQHPARIAPLSGLGDFLDCPLITLLQHAAFLQRSVILSSFSHCGSAPSHGSGVEAVCASEAATRPAIGDALSRLLSIHLLSSWPVCRLRHPGSGPAASSEHSLETGADGSRSVKNSQSHNLSPLVSTG